MHIVCLSLSLSLSGFGVKVAAHALIVLKPYLYNFYSIFRLFFLLLLRIRTSLYSIERVIIMMRKMNARTWDASLGIGR